MNRDIQGILLILIGTATLRISLGDIFRGTAPFTLIMVGVLLLLMVFPQLSLVLLK